MIHARRFALIGKSGAGKSEVAKMFADLLGCRIIKTGAICRQIAQILFANEDKSSTQALDDVLTAIHPSIFLRAAARGIASDEPIIVDALRFRSDLAIASELRCSVIRVSAPVADRMRRLSSRGQIFDLVRDGMHRSETELDTVPVDYEIRNTDDLAHLRLQVAALAASAAP